MTNPFSLEQIAKTGDLKADLVMKQCKLDKIAKLMEIKSISPKLKQSEKARELKKSFSTLQRYRREKICFRRIEYRRHQTLKQKNTKPY